MSHKYLKTNRKVRVLEYIDMYISNAVTTHCFFPHPDRGRMKGWKIKEKKRNPPNATIPARQVQIRVLTKVLEVVRYSSPWQCPHCRNNDADRQFIPLLVHYSPPHRYNSVTRSIMLKEVLFTCNQFHSIIHGIEKTSVQVLWPTRETWIF